jgi:hypothetical protein
MVDPITRADNDLNPLSCSVNKLDATRITVTESLKTGPNLVLALKKLRPVSH